MLLNANTSGHTLPFLVLRRVKSGAGPCFSFCLTRRHRYSFPGEYGCSMMTTLKISTSSSIFPWTQHPRQCVRNLMYTPRSVLYNNVELQ